VPGPRAPWWMYVVAASFLAFFALIFYYDLFGPDVPGLSFGPTFENRKGQMVVLSPPMNPAFERARAKTGDYVVSVDGQEVYTDSDWLAVAANLEVGRPVRLGIERGARHFEVQTTFERNQILGSLFRASFLPTEASRFLMLVVSLFIAFSRPYNLSARLGALILAAAAVNPPCYLPYGAAAGWRHLSVPVGAPLWVPCISRFVLGPLMCTLLAVFPRRLFRARLAMGGRLGAGTAGCALGYSLHVRHVVPALTNYRRRSGLGDTDAVSSSSRLLRGGIGDSYAELPPTGGPQREAPVAGVAGRLDGVGATRTSALGISNPRVFLSAQQFLPDHALRCSHDFPDPGLSPFVRLRDSPPSPV